MRKRRVRQQKLPDVGWREPGARIVIAIAIVVSLFAAWTMLASSGALDRVFSQKAEKKGPVSLASFTSPSKEYIYAGGRLVATEDPASPGCGLPPTPPGTLTATASFTSSPTSVDLSWPASTGAVDHYVVERKQHSNDNTYAVVIQNVPPASPTVSVTDTNGLFTDKAYIYRVRAFADSSGACPSAYSTIDLATTTNFSEAVVPRVTTIKAIHMTELRTAVNAVRDTAGLPLFNWNDTPVTETPASGGRVLRDQMKKLRDNLNEARTDLGLPRQSFTNEPLNIGDTIYAAHIQQLRDGVK